MLRCCGAVLSNAMQESVCCGQLFFWLIAAGHCTGEGVEKKNEKGLLVVYTPTGWYWMLRYTVNVCSVLGWVGIYMIGRWEMRDGKKRK